MSRACRRPTRQWNVGFGITLDTGFRHRSFKSTKSAQTTQQKIAHRPVMSGNKRWVDQRRVHKCGSHSIVSCKSNSPSHVRIVTTCHNPETAQAKNWLCKILFFDHPKGEILRLSGGRHWHRAEESVLLSVTKSGGTPKCRTGCIISIGSSTLSLPLLCLI